MNAGDKEVHVTLSAPGNGWNRIGHLIVNGMSGYAMPFHKSSTVAMVSGDPGVLCMEAPKRVGDGMYDMAFTTPAWWARAAMEGKAAFNTGAELRAIINLPHNDRLGFALRKDVGISSFEEIRDKRPPLRLVVSPPGTMHPGGWGAEKVLEAYGFSLKDIESWGGQVKWQDRQYDKVDQLIRGDIDGIFDEAIMTWAGAGEHVPIQYLGLSQDVQAALQENHGMPPAFIEAGRFPGVDEDVPAIDYRGHLVFCRSDLPDEVAYYAVRAFDRAQEKINSFAPSGRFHEDPLDLHRACQDTEIPLHPGAEAYYREHGYLA